MAGFGHKIKKKETKVPAPGYGWLLMKLSNGGAMTLEVFDKGGSTGIAAIVTAIILAFFIRETGAAVRPSALSKPA